jgi:uncharacterized membrane-anchored protein YjiN (DUF445 family)
MNDPRLISPSDLQRARALTTMRWVATGLLCLMAGVFVVSGIFMARWPWLAYVRAFAEAGMVGACADWFAVTALFRQPLGLPIPHTGIVPRKKDQIGEALGEFIAENFLTEAVLEAKLRQLEIARWGAAWLSDPANAERLAQRITSLSHELLDLVAPQARRDFVAAVVKDIANALPAASLASSVLRALWIEGRTQAFLDHILDFASRSLTSNEDMIRSQVSGRTLRWAPRWLDRRIGDRIIQVLAEVVEDMRRPDHPWREQVRISIGEVIERLDTDEAFREQVEGLKRELVAHPLVLENLEHVWWEAESRVNPQTAEGRLAMTELVSRLLRSAGSWLERRDDAREIFNGWARLATQRVIAPRRHEIGRFIAEIVAGWDTRSIVEKLELQVGRDLQYIRINGTLVGGLVGLAIFTLARWLSL